MSIAFCKLGQLPAPYRWYVKPQAVNPALRRRPFRVAGWSSYRAAGIVLGCEFFHRSIDLSIRSAPHWTMQPKGVNADRWREELVGPTRIKKRRRAVNRLPFNPRHLGKRQPPSRNGREEQTMVSGKEMIYSHKEAKTVRYILRNRIVVVVSLRDTGRMNTKEERVMVKNIIKSDIYSVLCFLHRSTAGKPHGHCIVIYHLS